MRREAVEWRREHMRAGYLPATLPPSSVAFLRQPGVCFRIWSSWTLCCRVSMVSRPRARIRAEVLQSASSSWAESARGGRDESPWLALSGGGLMVALSLVL